MDSKNVPGKDLVKEFLAFLKEYQIIGLGMAVVVGGAVNKLTKAFAEDIIMPIVGLLIPGGAWQALILKVGPVKLAIGDFLSNLIDFLIIAAIVFFFYKFILRQKEIKKI